jgi:hypothetical protein
MIKELIVKNNQARFRNQDGLGGLCGTRRQSSTWAADDIDNSPISV